MYTYITNIIYTLFLSHIIFVAIKKLSVSNASHVTLRSVDFNLNGNISCEVTTESPSFYTATATSVLNVVGEYETMLLNVIFRLLLRLLLLLLLSSSSSSHTKL